MSFCCDNINDVANCLSRRSPFFQQGLSMICFPLPFVCTESRWNNCEINCGQPRPEPCPPCPSPCPQPCTRTCADNNCPPNTLNCELCAGFRIPRNRCVQRVCAEINGCFWNNCRLVICYKVVVCYIDCCGRQREYVKYIRTACQEAVSTYCEPQVEINGELTFEVCNCWLELCLPVRISC